MTAKNNTITPKPAAPVAYRVNRFCDAMGLGRTKFYALVRQGKIRTVRIGGCRVVPASEVERLLREGA
jgi:excisionase family DNA binding protein